MDSEKRPCPHCGASGYSDDPFCTYCGKKASYEIRSDEPHERLTRICGAMVDTLEAHPERGEERCIVFLKNDREGGMVLHGYEDDTEAVADLFTHLRAIFRANGSDLQIHALGQG